MDREDIEFICAECDISFRVATELLELAGGDVELVCQASKHARGLDQCKITIIDGRFKKLEQSREED